MFDSKIFIQGLRVKTIIGVTEEERQRKSDVLINLEMRVDIQKAANTDRIGDAVDYEAIVKQLKAFVGNSQYHLLEALAEGVIEHIKAHFPVTSFRLYISKPGIIEDVDSVGLEIVG